MLGRSSPAPLSSQVLATWMVEYTAGTLAPAAAKSAYPFPDAVTTVTPSDSSCAIRDASALVRCWGVLMFTPGTPSDMFTTLMLYAVWLSITHCSASATVSCCGWRSPSAGSPRMPMIRALVATPIAGFADAAVPATCVPWPSGSCAVPAELRVTASYHAVKFGERSGCAEYTPESITATPMLLPSTCE